MNALNKILVTIGLIIVIAVGVKFLIPSGPADPPLLPTTGPEDLKQNHKANVPIDVKPEPDRYPPINQPEKLRLIREVGYDYTTIAVGEVGGSGSGKDFGIKGEFKYKYFYSFETKATVEKNDGRKIVELRQFKCTDTLIIDPVSVGLSLNKDEIVKISGVIYLIGGLIDAVGGGGGGTTGGIFVAEAIHGQNGQSLFTIRADQVRAFNKWLKSDAFDPERAIRAIIPGADLKILDGKTVRIVYEDGKGITSCTPIDCTLSTHERDLITRTNAFADNYVFPDATRPVGDCWDIPADNMGSFIDPRLRGSIFGTVKICRIADSMAQGGVVYRMRIDANQTITLAKDKGGRNESGTITITGGEMELPADVAIVTRVETEGSAEYQDLSTDHLLVALEIRSRPSFKGRVDTTKTKSK
jgi:hypothetical protein